MPKFDATINGISLASYGVEPNMATVPQPDAKTYQAEIPGRDGLLDYTDAYGVVRYENRTVTVEAYEIGDITARMEHRRAICSDMHGKTCTLALTTLPGYTFTGRCRVEYDEDGSETAYKLSFDCQPYMSAGECTFYANCAGGVDLVFMSGDKPVKPRIEVPRRSIIVFNGQQYEVEAGTWTFDGIVFKRGRNEVYINTYTEPGTTTWGDLESMTWEQIGWHHRQSEASGALVNVTDALQARPNKLAVDGKSAQTVGVWGTNLVTNDDFSNGTTGWETNGATNFYVSNNILFFTPTTKYGGARTSLEYRFPSIAGHKYYVANEMKTIDTFAITFLIGINGIGGNLPVGSVAADGIFHRKSAVLSCTTSSASMYLMPQSTAESAWSEIAVRYLIVIDLTAAFGAGNEPTAAQMDAYLAAYPNSWFDGSALLTTSGTPNSPSPDYPQEVDVVDSPVSVQAVGKNLIGQFQERTTKGVTCVKLGDGGYHLTGTATDTAVFNAVSSHMVFLPGTYVASLVGTGVTKGVALGLDSLAIYNAVGVTKVKTISASTSTPVYLYVLAGSTVDCIVYPQFERGSSATPYEPYTSTQQTITLPPNHNYLASLPDGTRDELVLRSDGVAVLVERVGKRVFNGSEAWSLLSGVAYGFRLRDTTLSGGYRQLICDRYTVREFAATSETQGVTASPQHAPNLFCFRDTTIAQTVDAWKAKLAASNVTVYYALATATVRYSADNGTTWSTTDPAAGQSAIKLQKGTNNVWCTDALSPNVTLNYDTQERTRKQRVSELYWRKNQPQRRLTWGQLATHTWGEIGSKSVQEWYYSGTAYVVENAYINYEIGDL